MNILLVQPKIKRRPMDTGLKAKMSPSLALLTLQSLTPPEHYIKIVNENIEGLDYNISVDLVAITITVDVLDRAVEIAREFHKHHVIVIAGGIHVTADPEGTGLYFDAICVGKAEATWNLLLEDMKKGCLKKQYIDDYSNYSICRPDYSIIDGNHYVYTNVVSTSRGCPHKCDFCYNSCKNAVPYLNRPIADVMQDIITINRKHILFIDDNFIGNLKWAWDFLTQIKPHQIKWSAAVTANIINYPDLLDLMKESGCQSLFIGFESLNPLSLQQVNKNQNKVELFELLIKELHSRDIMVNASIVFGLPEDGPDVFKTTADWLIKNRVETATAHIMTPYPGTALYKKMLTDNRITDFDLSHYNTSHVVFRHEKMSAQQLYDGYIYFYKQFYSFKNIFKRIPIRKTQRISFLCFNFLYRKFGVLTDALSNIISLNYLGRLAAKVSYHLGR